MAVGIVRQLNPRRGMFIVQIDDGDFAVFELLDSIDISIGDRIRGDLTALGGETLFHVGESEKFEAYGQSGPSSLLACQRLIA